MNDILTGDYGGWPTVTVVAMIIIAALLIYRGVITHLRAVHPERAHELHAATRELDDERKRLKEGLQRILQSPDPLEAFIDAISGRSDRRRGC
jgi:hypothetical protein